VTSKAGNHLHAPHSSRNHNDIKALENTSLFPDFTTIKFIILIFETQSPNMSFQGHSNVGFPSLYESQNQKNHKQSEVDELQRHTGENLKGFLHSQPTRFPPTAVQIADRDHLNREPGSRAQPFTHPRSQSRPLSPLHYLSLVVPC
jgi:hypothetical protein